MTKLLDSTEEETVLDYLRDWVALLAQGRFDDAHAWLYRAGHFTPADIRDWIFRYSPVVNDPRTLDLSEEQSMIEALEKPDENGREVFGVEYFLPLNGEWSPMRASFFLREVGEGRFGLELTDISMA